MDRIVLSGMRFSGRHGVSAAERELPQPLEVDLELLLGLAAAGKTDELDQTVDYAAVFQLVREIVESRSFRLLEALAETVADEVRLRWPVAGVVVRVRKLRVPVTGQLEWAGVEISRP